jgi:hypothetical protein
VLGEPVELGPQDLPRCHLHPPSVGPDGVAEHQRRARPPRHPAQGRQVGAEPEVSEPALGRADGGAADWLHLDVRVEQVGADVEAAVQHPTTKVVDGHPTAL